MIKCTNLLPFDSTLYTVAASNWKYLGLIRFNVIWHQQDKEIMTTKFDVHDILTFVGHNGNTDMHHNTVS